MRALGSGSQPRGVMGMQLTSFPNDDELFDNRGDFFVAYANAQTEHIEMQYNIARDTTV